MLLCAHMTKEIYIKRHMTDYKLNSKIKAYKICKDFYNSWTSIYRLNIFLQFSIFVYKHYMCNVIQKNSFSDISKNIFLNISY